MFFAFSFVLFVAVLLRMAAQRPALTAVWEGDAPVSVLSPALHMARVQLWRGRLGAPVTVGARYGARCHTATPFPLLLLLLLASPLPPYQLPHPLISVPGETQMQKLMWWRPPRGARREPGFRPVAYTARLAVPSLAAAAALVGALIVLLLVTWALTRWLLMVGGWVGV